MARCSPCSAASTRPTARAGRLRRMSEAVAARRNQSLAFAAMPAVFVFLWSTGFIGAKFGLPYVEPLTFLALRFAIVIGLLLALIAATGAPWPRDPRQIAH